MDELFRRLRGLAGVGVTWGVSWAAIGACIGLVIGVVSGEASLVTLVSEWAVGMGLYGVVSGVGFGGLLSFGEARRRILDLSLGRVATWGVLGSAAVPIFFGVLGMFAPGTTAVDVIEAMFVTAFLGGSFATGSVAVARRAELAAPDDPMLLRGGGHG